MSTGAVAAGSRAGSGLVGVTGATGAIGGAVAAALAAAGRRQRLVVRDASRAPAYDDAEVAVASYDEPDALRAAFTGLDALLLVSAAEHPDRIAQHYRAVDAAAEAGVPRIVYTSFLGAAPDATFTLARHHFLTEARLRERGLTATILRDSLYLDFLPFMAGEQHVIAGPAGDGLVAPVARADVADVAAAVLLSTDGSHDGRTYELTGGRLQSMADWAAELAEVTGRAVGYLDETIEEAYASRAQYGAPDWEVEGWVTSYLAVARGDLAVRTDDVETLSGHPPRSLRDLLTP
jgi:NAD(P)H dehydrogenase (quinone)